jgi:hypothetical protein
MYMPTRHPPDPHDVPPSDSVVGLDEVSRGGGGVVPGRHIYTCIYMHTMYIHIHTCNIYVYNI